MLIIYVTISFHDLGRMVNGLTMIYKAYFLIGFIQD